MNIRTVAWRAGHIKIIDQTRLPSEFKYIHIRELKALWKAIKTLQVRGAPAIGAAAGLGVYLGIKDSRTKDFAQFNKQVNKVAGYIASARPTARNLFWAIERLCSVALRNRSRPVAQIKGLMLKEALMILEEDRAACRKMGFHGRGLIKNNDTILTICNAGALATIDYGTALGVIYSAKEAHKRIKVFACETRLFLQGARLTTWELKRKGIDFRLICDNTAATLMRQGLIDKVIVGADRIAANADTANKIGTYNLAVLSRYHGIPFYVAAPVSTFDFSIKSGEFIPIEERDSSEITRMFFKNPVAAEGTRTICPAFDVTPTS